MTAADWQAVADWVIAVGVIFGATSLWRRLGTASGRFWRRLRKKMTTILDREVTAGAAWESVTGSPEVSMESGIAYARAAAQSGHPPHMATTGPASPDQPLGYLLAKMAEMVWDAVSAAHTELEPYQLPLRNYLGALSAKTGISQARDFALGVLTERVRQEENGWPDQPGDPSGKRTAHGTGSSHLCLLERKHKVEDAIYSTPTQA